MKIKRILKSIAAIAVALGLALLPAGDIPVLWGFGVTASAATSGTTSTGLPWKIEGGTLEITGIGEIPNYNFVYVNGTNTGKTNSPWVGNEGDVTKIVIGSGVTKIGSDAFVNFKKVKSITILGPAKIGMEAFRNSDALETVNIHKGAKLDGSGVFSNSGGQSDCIINTVNIIDGNGSEWTSILNGKGEYGGFKEANVKYVREVTFNANGGSCAVGSQYVAIKDKNGDIATENLDIPTPTRTNHTFLGWYTAADGGDKITTSGLSSKTSSIPLYAHWQENEYTISFNANGGTGSPADQKTSGKKLTSLPDSAVSKTGYTLDGWYTSASGGTQITTSTTFSSNQTVYAHWKANTYTVAYNGNGSTGGSTANSSHTYDAAKALTANGFTRQYTVTYDAKGGTDCASQTAAYTFKYWTTGTADSGTTYTNSQSVKNLTATANGTVTLYAQWNSAAVTLPAPTKTGYTFDGWYSGDTKIGMGGASYTPTENITLTAKWKANTYTVTFDPNGGSCGTPSKTVTYNSTYGDLPVPTRTGYTFAGWFTSASGGTQVTSGTTVAITAAQTLYAHWTINQYTVTFDTDGGSAVAAQTVDYGETVAEPAAPTKTGYTFNKWQISSGNGTYEDVTFPLTVTEDITVYARWTANIYTVTFDANGGECDTTDMNVTYDSAYGELPTPTRTGHTFSGWYTAASGGTQVTSGTTVNITSAQTLYAHWGAKTYNVTLNTDYGTINSGNVTSYTYGVGAPLPTAADITRTGYTFEGWFDNSGCTGTAVTAITVTDLGDKEFWAKWTANTYTVTYNGNGNTGGATGNSIHTYATESALTENGFERIYTVSFDANGGTACSDETAAYTFKHWTVTTEDAGTSYNNGATVLNLTAVPNGTVTLYAQWNSKSVTLPAPTREGYNFDGWYEDPGFSGSKCSSSYTPARNITLYARWDAKHYDVTLNTNSGTINSGNVTGYTYGVGAVLPTAADITRTGYTFEGWFDNSGCTGTAVAAISVTDLGDKEFWAKWTANTYTVTYNGNGNTGGATADSIHTYNTESTLTPNGFERKYTVTYNANGGTAPASDTAEYTFTNWTYGGTSYDNVATVLNLTTVPNDIVTLYAQWSSDSVTLPVPARDGYTFGGWYTDPGFSGYKYSEGDSYTPTADITFYANWSCVHIYGEEAAPSAANLKKAATCTDKAVYYKVCARCGDVHATETYEYGEPLGHDFVCPPERWDWAADYSSAAAIFACANDPSHKDAVSAGITSAPVTVTCTQEGDMNISQW